MLSHVLPNILMTKIKDGVFADSLFILFHNTAVGHTVRDEKLIRDERYNHCVTKPLWLTKLLMLE